MRTLADGIIQQLDYDHAAGYYSRLVAAAAHEMNVWADARFWSGIQAGLVGLRQGYRGGAVQHPYARNDAQLAYSAAYVPHYAAQLDRALRLHQVDVEGLLVNDASAEVMCIGCGPGTELLGLAYHIVGHAMPRMARSIRATLVDHPRHAWLLGRALLRHQLCHHEGEHGLGKLDCRELMWDLLHAGRIPVEVRTAARNARLVTVMNMLTEVTQCGLKAEHHFVSSLAAVFDAMAPGAVLLIADMGRYDGSRRVLHAAVNMLQSRAAQVTGPVADLFRSPFASVDHTVLREHLFSRDRRDWRIPRATVRSMSFIARKR